MSTLPAANGQSPPKETTTTQPKDRPAKPKKKGCSFAQIHSKPLPLEIHPLPAFHPSNPISLLRIAYTWISHLLYPPTSHAEEPYVGYFSLETRSVHVTDPKHVRALWEMGFFGKGTLSRSEPSWLEREKARVMSEMRGSRGRKAAEDATIARREERRLFKLERARAEREKIERQRLAERGELEAEDVDVKEEDVAESEVQAQAEDETLAEDQKTDAVSEPLHEKTPADLEKDDAKKANEIIEAQEIPEPNIDNQEHLQLTLEEAFFLSYALGVLTILPPQSPPTSTKPPPSVYTATTLLSLFAQHSTFPPSTCHPAPDDPFLLSYITYHHFRSLGWVVRPGVKFGADYLLYNRGPVFSHAEFAVLVMPSYSHRYWNSPGGRGQRRVQGEKDWWWLHCVNRVQGQVKKTLVLAYVEVPSPFEVDWEGGVGEVFGRYKLIVEMAEPSVIPKVGGDGFAISQNTTFSGVLCDAHALLVIDVLWGAIILYLLFAHFVRSISDIYSPAASKKVLLFALLGGVGAVTVALSTVRAGCSPRPWYESAIQVVFAVVGAIRTQIIVWADYTKTLEKEKQQQQQQQPAVELAPLPPHHPPSGSEPSPSEAFGTVRRRQPTSSS
ncbi:tRNA splicing endonuclease subunit sen2 [Saxophila tyrrhenica]|uniref:tRNA-intron lyase n=1 Tax=Saxophila tyrrhenica TaxID=1690608 RepID=A0AAV9NYD5_9PEZI|nr:tRNA splicing endonuclease subunit sen2 [Saxophila tyrrhenica]